MNAKLILSTYNSNTSPWAMKFRYPEIDDREKEKKNERNERIGNKDRINICMKMYIYKSNRAMALLWFAMP